MENQVVRIVSFVLSVITVFMLLGVYLFRLSGAVVPSSADGAVSVDAGEAIFNGAGKCYSCHSFGDTGSAVRCPNLGVKAPKFAQPVGVRAADRKPDVTAIEYIVESIYDPNAYVVKGFPKGVMKPINRPPIALSDGQITSVILYLLDQSGVEVTDDVIGEVTKAQLPFVGKVADSGGSDGPALNFPEGDAEEGFYVFEKMKCFQCHLIEGAEFDPGDLTPEDLAGGVGPDLTGVGAIQTFEYLYESVVNPNALVLPDPSPDKKYSGDGGVSKMPDFLDTLTARELVDLVTYLKSLGDESAVDEDSDDSEEEGEADADDAEEDGGEEEW